MLGIDSKCSIIAKRYYSKINSVTSLAFLCYFKINKISTDYLKQMSYLARDHTSKKDN